MRFVLMSDILCDLIRNVKPLGGGGWEFTIPTDV